MTRVQYAQEMTSTLHIQGQEGVPDTVTSPRSRGLTVLTPGSVVLLGCDMCDALHGLLVLNSLGVDCALWLGGLAGTILQDDKDSGFRHALIVRVLSGTHKILHNPLFLLLSDISIHGEYVSSCCTILFTQVLSGDRSAAP